MSTADERPGVSFEQVREWALALPSVEERLAYGTPAFFIRKKLILRLKEDGESLVVKTDFYERQHLMETQPDVFYITDHYRDYPAVLVRLPAAIPSQLRALVLDAWRRFAPRRLADSYQPEI